MRSLSACPHFAKPNRALSAGVAGIFVAKHWHRARLPSAIVENISVNYEAGAAALARELFGALPPDDDVAGLAGALDGARINVSVRRVGLFLAVEHPLFECYETSIRRDRDGGLYAYIHDVRKRGREPKHLTVRAFMNQVATARRLGLRRFELYAAGTANDTKFSGYRFWPQVGFNALLYDFDLLDLPPDLAGCRDLNQLMLMPNGVEWWKRRGSERSMAFDLDEQSTAMKVFRHRLKELGIEEK